MDKVTTRDKCPMCERYELQFDEGEDATLNEPGYPPYIYCDYCDSTFQIDWDRFSFPYEIN